MKRVAVLLMCGLMVGGCGTYRITYKMPSRTPETALTGTSRGPIPAPPIKKRHSHGIGPFIIGGGLGLFWLFSQVSPALIDYSGTRNIPEVCPHGIAEVSHQHTFGQNAGAAVLSWLLVLNWRHTSDELWVCAEPEAQPKLGNPLIHQHLTAAALPDARFGPP